MAYIDQGQGFYSGDFARLLGGDASVVDPTAIRKGVHAKYPATTPKYRTDDGEASLQTMARLLIPITKREIDDFVKTFSSPESRALAKSLLSTGNTGDGVGFGYLDFLLTQAQESFQEKVQIVDVLSDNYVAYFFGSTPPVFSFSGNLMNSEQDDWRSAFTLLYLDVLRGTQLARRGKVVTLAYDKRAVTGAFIGMSDVLTAEMQLASTFSFQMLVRRIDIERTLNHPPTQALVQPYAVDAGQLASMGNSLAAIPRTIRTVLTPRYATTERQKENPPAAQEATITDTSFDPVNDVKPAPVVSTSETGGLSDFVAG